MTIGQRIRGLRSAKGYTQELVAERLGISRQAVCKWEQDQTTPDTNNLIRLSKLLDTTVDYLVTGEANEQDQTLEQMIREQEMVRMYTVGRNWLIAALVSLLAMFLIPAFAPVCLILTIIFGILGIRYQRKAAAIDHELSGQQQN